MTGALCPSDRPRPDFLCLLGLSGVGKSTLARHVAERLGWARVELDQPDVATAWPPECVAAFARFAGQGEPGDFVAQLRALAARQGQAGAVLCFRSHDRVSPEALAAVQALGGLSAVLRAGMDQCIEAYLGREVAFHGGSGVMHWIRHNTQAHGWWQGAAFDPWALEAFGPDRRRRPVEALFAELFGRDAP